MHLINRTRIILPLALACALLVAYQPGSDERELSVEEKKHVVYRMYRDYKGKDFPSVTDMSPGEAMSLMRSGEIMFVDGRTQAEMNVSMLPDAITRRAFLDNVESYRNKTVVAYCTISYRSGLFAKEMAARGVTVYNLQGGILAWALEGGEVHDHNGVSRRIHVYGDKWDYAPSGYETVKFSFLERLIRFRL